MRLQKVVARNAPSDGLAVQKLPCMRSGDCLEHNFEIDLQCTVFRCCNIYRGPGSQVETDPLDSFS